MNISYFKHGDKHTRDDFNFFEAHHYFWGDIIGLIGFYGVFNWSEWIFWPIAILGSWVRIDDLVQHILQRIEMKVNKELHGEEYYTIVSFWHWIFYKKYWR